MTFFLPSGSCKIALAIAAAATFFWSPPTRAASPAVDNLISRLPNPDQWQKSPLETAMNEPGLTDPQLRKLQDDLRRKDIAAALRDVRALSSRYPKSVNVQFLYGAVCLATHQNYEAEGAFRYVVSLQPKNASALFALATALAAQGRFASALAPLRRATLEAPRNHVLLLSLGVCNLRAGHPAEGEASCRQALRIKSDFSPTWDVLGLCLRQQGKRAEALTAFERATGTPPPNANAWTHLAETLRASGRQTEADAASERAKQLLVQARFRQRR